MTDKQPEALRLAGLLELAPEDGVEPQTTEDAAAELRRQHTRIAELEAQLSSSGFTAADMATASAQGFRDGVASIAASAGSEPVATYSVDADPLSIRSTVAEAITGALAFGAQGVNQPPEGHWLAPFWKAAREDKEAAELAHRDREIDRLRDENTTLQQGYAAARLEIESLQARIKAMAEERADELVVAHLDGRMRASHGQAPAQAIPAAAAGCTRSHPHENMDSACRAKAAIAEMQNMAARGAEATTHDLERFVAMLAAAPTTQPAPTTPQADSQPAPDEIINMAREQGLPETEIEGVFRVNADDLCRVAAAILAARAPADSVLEDAARWKMAVLVGNEVMLHPEKRTHPAAVKAYMDAVHSGLDLTGAIDAARKQGANHD